MFNNKIFVFFHAFTYSFSPFVFSSCLLTYSYSIKYLSFATISLLFPFYTRFRFSYLTGPPPCILLRDPTFNMHYYLLQLLWDRQYVSCTSFLHISYLACRICTTILGASSVSIFVSSLHISFSMQTPPDCFYKQFTSREYETRRCFFSIFDLTQGLNGGQILPPFLTPPLKSYENKIDKVYCP